MMNEHERTAVEAWIKLKVNFCKLLNCLLWRWQYIKFGFVGLRHLHSVNICNCCTFSLDHINVICIRKIPEAISGKKKKKGQYGDSLAVFYMNLSVFQGFWAKQRKGAVEIHNGWDLSMPESHNHLVIEDIIKQLEKACLKISKSQAW